MRGRKALAVPRPGRHDGGTSKAPAAPSIGSIDPEHKANGRPPGALLRVPPPGFVQALYSGSSRYAVPFPDHTTLESNAKSAEGE